MDTITAVQEDYLEVVLRLEQERGQGAVRISDIADRLGTRLPTVTRTVQKLTEMGLLLHDERRDVRLSERGRKAAREILHRHEDLQDFFTSVLGLADSEAERTVCQIEHGLSSKAAQRLHEFLEYLDSLEPSQRALIQQFKETASAGRKDFRHLPDIRQDGWRS